MVEIDELLSQDLQVQMDGVHEQDEERRLCLAARSYSICEHSIAVLSNLRTGRSHIFFGKSCQALGIGQEGTVETVASVWEKEILDRIHPDDWKGRCLHELAFFRIVSSAKGGDAFSHHMVGMMRMRGRDGAFHYWKHRIFYFPGNGRKGVCFALCLYNPDATGAKGTWLVDSMTGKTKPLPEGEANLLSEREKRVLQMAREGMSSKMIADELGISKHTVDRHRQNIIAKLRTGNTTEACHKAKQLGLID